MYSIYLRHEDFERRLKAAKRAAQARPSLGLVYVLGTKEATTDQDHHHWLWSSLVCTGFDEQGAFGLRIRIEEHNIPWQYGAEWARLAAPDREEELERATSVLRGRAKTLIERLAHYKFPWCSIESAYFTERGMLDDLDTHELDEPEWWTVRSEINGRLLPYAQWNMIVPENREHQAKH